MISWRREEKGEGEREEKQEGAGWRKREEEGGKKGGREGGRKIYSIKYYKNMITRRQQAGFLNTVKLNFGWPVGFWGKGEDVGSTEGEG